MSGLCFGIGRAQVLDQRAADTARSLYQHLPARVRPKT